MIVAATALAYLSASLAVGVLTMPPSDCYAGTDAFSGSLCMVLTGVGVPLVIGVFFVLAWLVVWAVTRVRWWSLGTVLAADAVAVVVALVVASIAPGVRVVAIAAAVALGAFVGVALAAPRGTPRTHSVVVASLGVVAAAVAAVAAYGWPG